MCSMYIRSKDQLFNKIKGNLPQYPIIEKHFSTTINNLLLSKKTLRSLLEIPLIRYLGKGSPTIQNFENYLKEKSFTNIEAPLKRLKTNLIEYPAVLAELETAKKLLDDGMTNITFMSQQNSHPDIKFTEDGKIRYAEVKDLMSVNPEFGYLNNKFEAMSLVSKDFKKSFIVECEYPLYKFDSIQSLHNKLNMSIDKLIKNIKPQIKIKNLDHEKITINDFNFTITTKPSPRKEFLFLFSGGGIYYGNVSDVFLSFANIYSRLINEIKKGYIQLLNQRSNDKELTKNDRLYIYLNIELNSFSGDNIKKIFSKMTKIIGVNDLIKLKIIL